MHSDQPPDPTSDALAQLVDDGTLSPEQAARVADALRAAGPTREDRPLHRVHRQVTAAEVLSYLGAAVTIGALVLVVGLSWDELDRVGKLLTCGAVSLVLGAAAVAVARWDSTPFEQRRHAVASAVAALASIGAAITANLTVDLLAAHGAPLGEGAWDMACSGAVLAALGVLAYLPWRGPPSVCAMFVGGLVLTSAVLDIALGDRPARSLDELAYPLVVYAYGACWVVAGRLLRSPHVPAVLGGVVAAGTAAFTTAGSYPTLGLVLGGITAAGMFLLFGRTHRWWYAAIGALTALVVPPTGVAAIAGDTALAAVVLLAVGILLVAAALLAGRHARRSARRS